MDPKQVSSKGGPKQASSKGGPKQASSKGDPKQASSKGGPKQAKNQSTHNQKQAQEGKSTQPKKEAKTVKPKNESKSTISQKSANKKMPKKEKDASSQITTLSNLEVNDQTLEDFVGVVTKLYPNQNEWIEEFIQNFMEFDKEKYQTTFSLMNNAIMNLMTYPKGMKKEENELHKKVIGDAINAMLIYMIAIVKNQKNEEICEVESKLFQMTFQITESLTRAHYQARIFPVYLKHDEFVNPKSPYCLFKSSTGSGKTRCTPFFISSLIYSEHLTRPFFIMTQPSTAIAKDKIEDLEENLGNSVKLVSSPMQMIKLYQNASQQTKPIIGVFSPYVVLKLLSMAEEQKINIFPITRFCLDEIHERSVDLDVLLAKISSSMKLNQPFKGQILLMSATPDKKIINCFGDVEILELNDSSLFPVDYILEEIEYPRQAPSSVLKSIMRIITDMSTGIFEYGHILSFLPGNQMIIDVICELEKCIKGNSDFELIPSSLLKETDTVDSFEKNLQNYIETKHINNSLLAIFPIKLAGFVPKSHKEIAQKPFKRKFTNIVKIICATNAVESSITIDGLASVIDSGLFNNPITDNERGITELITSPITTKMQTQRAGRVGRTRPGRSVKITLKNRDLMEDIMPEILTTDLSSSVLHLRSIGINLEDVKGLPDDPGQQKLSNIIETIKKQGLIDANGVLTKNGKKVESFEGITPTLAFVVIKSAEKYSADERKALYECLGCLIVFVISSQSLIGNYESPKLQEHFCFESDIVTIIRTFLDLASSTQKKEDKARIISYGFQEKPYKELNSSMNKIFHNLIPDIVKEKKSWDFMSKFVTEIDILSYVNQFISLISSSRPQWASTHQAKFQTMSGLKAEPKAIYYGDSSLSFENQGPLIVVNCRPGSLGFEFPGHATIFDISRNKENQLNYGSLIHENKTHEQIMMPHIYKSGISCNSPFFEALVNLNMQNDSLTHFQLMTNSYNVSGGDSGTLFYQKTSNNSVSNSFIPKTEEAAKEIIKAFKAAESLLPFVAKSILIENDFPHCAVEVSVNGSQEYSTQLHMLNNKNKNLPLAFNLNHNVIQFLLQNLTKLADDTNIYRIAITGEALSFSLNDDHQDIPIQLISYSNPKSVFGHTKYDYSRLVLLISTGEKTPPGESPLLWMESSITAQDVYDDYITNVANKVSPGLIKATHQHDLFVLKPRQSFKVIGSIPFIKELPNGTSSNLSEIIGLFQQNYAQGHSLRSEIPLATLSYRDSINYKKEIAINMQKKQELKNNLDNGLIDKKTAMREIGVINKLITSLNENKTKLEASTPFPVEKLNETGIHAKERQIFGALCLNTNEPISALKINEITNSIQEIACSSGIQFSSIEHLTVVTIQVFHRIGSRLTPEDFEKTIRKVCQKFGFLINYISNYNPNKVRKGDVKGKIFIDIIDSVFSISLAGEIRNAIIGSSVQFQIPSSILHKSLISDTSVLKCLEDWLVKHNLTQIKKDGFDWNGPQEIVEKAYRFLFDPNTTFQIPKQFFAIPSSISDQEIIKLIKMQNSNESKQKWIFNRHFRGIIANTNDEPKIRKFLISKAETNDDILGCILCCENPILSNNKLTAYYKDHKDSMKVCIDCMRETLEYSLSTFFNPATGIDFDMLMGTLEKIPSISVLPDVSDKNETWPKIPIGQLLWLLCQEAITCDLSKAWLTAVAAQSMHAHPESVTFCPYHCNIILALPDSHEDLRCTVKSCNMILCSDCYQWHEKDNCSHFVWNGKRCPGCKKPTIKEDGCNHISCPCGAHWCYECEAGPFPSGGECYNHMTRCHGSYWNQIAN